MSKYILSSQYALHTPPSYLIPCVALDELSVCNKQAISMHSRCRYSRHTPRLQPETTVHHFEQMRWQCRVQHAHRVLASYTALTWCRFPHGVYRAITQILQYRWRQCIVSGIPLWIYPFDPFLQSQEQTEKQAQNNKDRS